MVNTPVCPYPTNSDKVWSYDQYYIGDRDAEKRKNGYGENHWTSAESIEWYAGRFLRNTMHGEGECRSRCRGDRGVCVTYEGHFYANCMHGYGAMSYPDGAIFTGLFHNDVRWGPGIESHACLQEDVGFWRGIQLVRLAWKPDAPNVALDISVGPNGTACVEPHRILLTTIHKTVGEVNSAIELLKQSGAEPVTASKNWVKLYPKTCTDLASQMCHVAVFEQDYYKSRVSILEEVDSMPDPEEKVNGSQKYDNDDSPAGTFYAWNNNEMMKHMMKHCFKHERQRHEHRLDMKSLLSGPRRQFKRAGKHEIDCRTLLMASYLGHIKYVAQLVNESNVHPDVADLQGNTALMYAACGDQVDTIHFLVEAGADVNGYNDACCTPLGVAVMRFACAKLDVSPSGMVQALIPPIITPFIPSIELKPLEWHMIRNLPVQSLPGVRSPNKAAISKSMTAAAKRVKSIQSMETANIKRKTELIELVDLTDDANGDFSEDKMRYNHVNTEFTIRVSELFSYPSKANPIPYIFEVNDMVKEVDAAAVDTKKPEKLPKKALSKVLKETMKPSKEIMLQSPAVDDFGSIDSTEKIKIEMVSHMMLTILQLLDDGADPKLIRCPQPALFIAVASGCPDLVRHLVNYGADVNEVFPQALNYSAIDVAVSRPFTYENIDLVKTVLECGARTAHRLPYGVLETEPVLPDIPGPTLLHAVLARTTESDLEEEFRQQILGLLLEYNCDPMVFFRGRSATDIAMSKNMDILDIFIRCPQTNLNAEINDCNQTVLVKMFSNPFFKTIPAPERLQTVTNFLLFGADPLLECRDGDDEFYKNIFEFAKKTIVDLESPQSKPVSSAAPLKGGAKNNKKPEKPDAKKVEKLPANDAVDYKQMLDVMTECARMLYIRWLQAKLFKELLQIVVKYKHRQWNMILPEHKNKKVCGLWLQCGRALEIWDILKTTKRKLYRDKLLLKHLLCLILFYSKRSKTGFRDRLTAEEKGMIESKVKYILHDYKLAGPIIVDENPWSRRPYVTPELSDKNEEKYNVCFECAIPFEKEKIQCASCKLVSFCSYECMRTNVDRAGCHPCSEFLKKKYFPSPEESIVQDQI